jgi:AcrR family transcriptional regulator
VVRLAAEPNRLPTSPRKAPRRTRRTAEEARRVILDAAEKRLLEAGPAGLRLQEVAGDVGISHPAILHHFNSREELVAAVVTRALEALRADLMEALAATEPDPVKLVDRAFRTLSDRGYGRLVVWLGLSGLEPVEGQTWVRDIARMAHARRRKDGPGARRAPFEDTLFRAMVVGLVIFGESAIGDLMRRSAGLEGDARAAARFRVWLAGLLKV